MINSINREEKATVKKENYERKYKDGELVYNGDEPHFEYFPKHIREYIKNNSQANNSENNVFELGDHYHFNDF